MFELSQRSLDVHKSLPLIRDAMDAAHYWLLALAYSGIFRVNLRDTMYQEALAKWWAHGENHALLSALYVMRFGPVAKMRVFMMGGYAHDMGKLNHDNLIVWEKPSHALSAAEQRLKWRHVTRGEVLLARWQRKTHTILPAELIDIVAQHHERLDGTGGPRGLVGDQISFAGRLFTVLDQVVSRCEGRVDREPLPLHHAMWDVQSRADWYDPTIVANVSTLFASNAHMEIPSLRWLGQWRG